MQAKMKLEIDGRRMPGIPTKAENSATLAVVTSRGAASLVLCAALANDGRHIDGGEGTAGGADGLAARFLATVGELFPCSLRTDAAGGRWIDVTLPGCLLTAAHADDESNERLLFDAVTILARWVSCGNPRQVEWFTPPGTDADGNPVGPQPTTFAAVAQAVGIPAHNREGVSEAALAAGFTTAPRFNWSQVGAQSLTKSSLAMVRWLQAWGGAPSYRGNYGIDEVLADRAFGRPVVTLFGTALRKAGVPAPRRGKMVPAVATFAGEA